ncbi:MAG: undecaprenyl-diphosphate phosphatase [Candidatus Gracilibacteria bacterium]|nr:undecaprenyl-diphosphate phosphatase [Candidatus Gracilibacteria bacterium]
MTPLQSLLLGALQGITEFLPISSSGHLVLGEHFFSLDTSALKSFDVAVHMGTLLAILIYFWKDVWQMLKTFFELLTGKTKFDNPYAKLILYIVIGTIPAVIIGLLFEDWMDANFRNLKAVGTLMILVGITFYFGEMFYQKNYGSNLKAVVQKAVKKLKDFFGCDEGKGEIQGLTLRKAVIIGCAQALALLPGVSRSGSTIVAGLFQGIERSSAARFSFLLGIPAIFGAGILTFISGGSEILESVSYQSLIIGFVSSFAFGMLSVALLMQFLKKFSLNVFAVYLMIVGIITLIN